MNNGIDRCSMPVSDNDDVLRAQHARYHDPFFIIVILKQTLYSSNKKPLNSTNK
jgi:hypothetical protein